MPESEPDEADGDDEKADWQRRVVGRSLRTATEAVHRPRVEPDQGGGDVARTLGRRRIHGPGGRRRSRTVTAHAVPVLREQGRPPPGGVRGSDAYVHADDPRRHRRPDRPVGSTGRRHDRRGANARVQRDGRRPRAGATTTQAGRGQAGARRTLPGTGHRVVQGSRRRGSRRRATSA